MRVVDMCIRQREEPIQKPSLSEKHRTFCELHTCNSDDARPLLLIYLLVYLFNWYAHCLLREFQHSLALFIALPNLGISYWTPLLSPPHLHTYGQSELVTVVGI